MLLLSSFISFSRFFIFSFSVFFFAFTLTASGQTNRDAALADDIRKVADSLVSRHQSISARLESDADSLDQRFLERSREELKILTTDSLTILSPFIPRISSMLSRLRNLSAVGDDESEPLEIRLEREFLSQQKALVLLAIKDAELVSLRSRKLSDDILVQIRNRFLTHLFDRHSVSSVTFLRASGDFPMILSRLFRAINTWFFHLFPSHIISFSIILFLSVVLSCFFIVFFQRVQRLSAIVETTGSDASVVRLNRTISSFFSIIVPGVSVSIIALVFHFGFLYFDMYRFSMESLVSGLLISITSLVFACLLLSSILAPFSSSRRLVPLSDMSAKLLSLIYFSMAFTFSFDFLLGRILSIFANNIDLVIVKDIFTTLLISLFLVLSLFVRTRPLPQSKWHFLLFWSISFLVIVLVISLLFGYSGLGRFLSGQIILTGSVLALACLGFLSASALSESNTFAVTSLGRSLRGSFNFTDMRMDQLGLVVSILIRILIVLVTLPILLLQWGYPLDHIGESALTVLTGFSIGGFQFSLGRILIALFIFVALIILTKMVQNWVVNRVFSRTHLDSGVRNSLRSGLGYLGYFLAGLIGLSATGIQLSNIALVAGALSVGIGFGLQNIVNNFVSGIIMLIERPIKVGDIIAVSGTEGYVRKINVRATEIETFDHQSVIIPNSEVINTAVGNWMHNDSHRRATVSVGVAYGTDVELVRSILLDIAGNHPLTISGDEPFVYFRGFGDSSLDFEVRVIIRDINDILTVENDLRFSIVKAFADNNIEIPFPQRDLHIRSDSSKVDK